MDEHRYTWIHWFYVGCDWVLYALFIILVLSALVLLYYFGRKVINHYESRIDNGVESLDSVDANPQAG